MREPGGPGRPSPRLGGGGWGGASADGIHRLVRLADRLSSPTIAPDPPAHHCPLVQRHYALVGTCYALVQSAGPNSAAWAFVQSTVEVSSGLPFAYFGLPMKAFSVNKSDGSRRRLTRAAM